MLWLIILALGFWVFGARLKVPSEVRFWVIATLYAALILAHLVLPYQHPLILATGGSVAPLALLGGFIGLILIYRLGLRALRGRAERTQTAGGDTPGQTDTFNDTELERYARHIMLREIGGVGQKNFKQAKILVIGAGGLGAPALQYLAASGVGTIGVIDDDLVENSNLQRQVIHQDAAIGTPKVFSAQTMMLAQNPCIDIRPYHRRFTKDIAAELCGEFDLLLDGSDNFDTRYLANETAVVLGMPLISGALSQWEGQVAVFDPKTFGPCYACVFPSAPAEGLAPSCAEAGVFAPLPGVVGAMMAAEALKLLSDAGTALRGDMLIYDALYGETRKLKMTPRTNCAICGG